MVKRALLIVDHGSRRSEANDMLPELAALLRKESDFGIVSHAHMELVEPTIQQGFDACVSAGAEEVIVHPYFLSPGRHSTHDIPRLVAEAAAKHPAVSFLVTTPLGLHRKIGEVILERVLESLGSQKMKVD
jgi:sirohydrochlorin ferrochelatase